MTHTNTHTQRDYRRPAWETLVWLHALSSEFLTKDNQEAGAWERRCKQAMRGCHDSTEEDLREGSKMGTGVTGQENLSPSGFGPSPSPSSSMTLLHPAVPVLTATSNTLHLPSGSGEWQKGQLANSLLAEVAPVGGWQPMGILMHLMWRRMFSTSCTTSLKRLKTTTVCSRDKRNKHVKAVSPLKKDKYRLDICTDIFILKLVANG